MSKWKVYISSTFWDLKDYRAELVSLFENQFNDNFELTNIMERMYDDGTFTQFVDDCVEAVTASDIYIIIIGNRVGSFPPDEQRTYTEIELDTAIANNKKICGLRFETFDEDKIDNKQKHDEILNKFKGRYFHSFKDTEQFKNRLYEFIVQFAAKAPINKKNPYCGLAAFKIDDGPYFHGRDAELTSCLKKIVTLNKGQVMAIIGNSGTGKSSFVQAGLLYQLKTEPQYGFQDHTQVVVIPGNEPFSNLKYQLQLKGINWRTIEKAPEEVNSVIIYFDQFEEIITQCHTEEARVERQELLNWLNSLIENQNLSNKFTIICSFRSDFLSQLANYDLIKNHAILFPLNSLDYKVHSENWQDSMTQIITNPAQTNGVTMETELVDKMLEEIKEVEGSLPILQFTLQQIWTDDTVDDGQITSTEYNLLTQGKGIGGIVETHAEQVVKHITKGGKDKTKLAIVKSLFVNLVEVNENQNDVKRTIEKNDLLDILNVYPEQEVQEVFETLVSEKSRLLTILQDKDEKVSVTLIHEELIRKWERLKDWINERRDALQQRKRMLLDITAFKKGEEDPYNRSQIQRAKSWIEENPDLNNDIINEFLKESKKLNAKKLKKSYAVGISLWLIIAIVGYIMILRPISLRADAAKLRDQALKIVEEDPTIALRLASAAINKNDDSLSRAVANKIYFENSFYKTIKGAKGEFGYFSLKYDLIFSPDGNKLLIVDNSYNGYEIKYVKGILDLNNKSIIELNGDSQPMLPAIFSPDGTKVVTGSTNGHGIIWDLKGDILGYLKGPFIPRFRSDKTIAYVAEKSNSSFSFRGYDEGEKILFSEIDTTPLNDTVIGVYNRGEVILFKETLERVNKFKHASFESIYFSKNGNEIFIECKDSITRVYGLKGKPIREFRTEINDWKSNLINDLAFNGIRVAEIKGVWDEPYVLATFQDRKIMLVEVKIVEENEEFYLEVLVGNNGKIIKLLDRTKFESYYKRCTISPDGELLIIWRKNSDFYDLWNLIDFTKKKVQLDIDIERGLLQISPDNKSILGKIGNEEYTLGLFDLEGNILSKFKGHLQRIQSATFCPEGQHLLTSSFDGTTRLWDLSGTPILEFKNKEYLEYAFNYDNPDGNGGDDFESIFTPNGNQIITYMTLKNHPLLIWDLKYVIHDFVSREDDFTNDELLNHEQKSLLEERMVFYSANNGRYYYWNQIKTLPDNSMYLIGYTSRFGNDSGTSYSNRGINYGIEFWNPKGEKIYDINTRLKGDYGSDCELLFDISPDGKYLITVLKNNIGGPYEPGEIILWTINGTFLHRFKNINSNHVLAVRFSNYGKSVKFKLNDGTAIKVNVGIPEVKEFLNRNMLDILNPEEKKKYNIN